MKYLFKILASVICLIIVVELCLSNSASAVDLKLQSSDINYK